jgi:hypothetical protein
LPLLWSSVRQRPGWPLPLRCGWSELS